MLEPCIENKIRGNQINLGQGGSKIFKTQEFLSSKSLEITRVQKKENIYSHAFFFKLSKKIPNFLMIPQCSQQLLDSSTSVLTFIVDQFNLLYFFSQSKKRKHISGMHSQREFKEHVLIYLNLDSSFLGRKKKLSGVMLVVY